MKASCLQENLNKGLSIASRAVAVKNQLPILGSLLLASDKGRIKISATNLETGINFWLGAKIEKEGSLAIPAKALAETVASLPPGKIDLEASAEILKVSCGFCKASFNGMSSQEFPSISLTDQKAVAVFPADVFLEAISQVAFAAAQDEGKPTLTGVKWIKDKEGLVLAATDGYRLSVKKLPLKTLSLPEEGIIVSARTLLEVVRILQEKERGKKESKEETAMFHSAGENQVSFFVEDVEVITRLIEGEFPDFSRIIPQDSATRVVLEKEALLKATRVAAVFARDSANIVKWKIGKEGISLSANSPQVGENSSEVEGKVEGEGGEIAFNFRFLLDFLGAIKSEEIVFEMTGPLNPGVFKPLKDPSFFHIIMPVRLQG